MSIEKCYKCDGSGSILIPETTGLSSKFGEILSFKSVNCPRCLGSGAVDIRIVEVSPAKQEEK